MRKTLSRLLILVSTVSFFLSGKAYADIAPDPFYPHPPVASNNLPFIVLGAVVAAIIIVSIIIVSRIRPKQ